MLWAVLLEVRCALGIVSTAIALFPVITRQHEGIAMGYVGLCTLEAGIIAVGVLPLLTVVTLRQQLAGTAGADIATLVALGQALVGLHNWTVILGPGLVCPANTVLLTYLMCRSGLVPRFILVLGLVGAPLVFAYNAALPFGISEHIPPWVTIAVVPLFAWEVRSSSGSSSRGSERPRWLPCLHQRMRYELRARRERDMSAYGGSREC